MPTTSPACTSKDAGLMSGWRPTPRTSSSTSPPRVARSGNSCSTLRPTMCSTSLSVDVSGGSPTATVRPSESTVTRSPIRLTSSSRCEM